jgi:hypothetical protein
MDTRIVRPNSYQNPVITLMAIASVLLLVSGGLLAISAHDWLSHVTWDGDDVDAKRHQQNIGQALALASLIPGSIFVILCGVRHETNRVLGLLAPEAFE